MPKLMWTGREKVINHHKNVSFKFLDFKYNFGGTSDNKIIHGDNLEVLKALLPRYEGRIKCIYIDPPYNTGNEGWVYNDNVNDPQIKKWLNQVVGKEGEDFNRHDKWLCMMYPRLRLMQKLLSDDGAIFISIDDNEQANLKLICDEIFGRQNFLAQVVWERAYAPVNLKKHFSESHDYIICYAKNLPQLVCHGLPRNIEANSKYKNPDNDPRGVWKSDNFSVGPAVEKNIYEITTPSGRKVLPPSGYSWRLSIERFEEFLADNRIWFGKDGDNVPSIKRFLSEVKQGITPMTIWKYTEVGHSQDATQELKDIFNGKAVFTYPKSVALIKRCFELYSDKDSIILDAFAGSGTTAHAVINLNQQDSGNRKFILIESMDYCETITAERVRRIDGKFDYYELGEPLFINKKLNPKVMLKNIREYIYYSETRQSIEVDDEYYLGTYNDTAYYFCYSQGNNIKLNQALLKSLSDNAAKKVIYAQSCDLSEKFLSDNNITFKKIPRDIMKF